MSKDYGYINARIKGMKSRLLSRDRYRDLLGHADMERQITLLKSSSYAQDIESGLSKSAGIEGLEKGLTLNLIRTMRSIESVGQSESADIVGIMIGRWESFNLKTIIRGKHRGLLYEQIAVETISCGEMNEAAIQELCRAMDVKGVIDMISRWRMSYAQPLKLSLPLYEKGTDTLPIELAIDRHLYADMLARSSGRGDDLHTVNRFIKRHIDLTNIMTCIRLLSEKIDNGMDYFIDGGVLIDRKRFERLIASISMDNLLSALAGSGKNDHFWKILEKVNKDEPGHLEFLFDKALYTEYSRTAVIEPLSINVLLSYLLLKYAEVRNLRLILRGGYYQMPQEEISSRMHL